MMDNIDPIICPPDPHLGWKLRYIKRMVERGIDPRDASLCCDAGDDHDYTSSPEDAADEEMSYWTDDGDE